jgi:hypothetical protein
MSTYFDSVMRLNEPKEIVSVMPSRTDFVFQSSPMPKSFQTAIDYEYLTEDIWKTLVRRLKGLSGEEFRNRRFFCKTISGCESNVISRFPEILNQFRNQRLKLLYRGSRDGFDASNFHAKYDNQSHTITFICTTKDFIFDGYTPLSWDSTSGYKADSSHRSFVFTITNRHNLTSRKFGLKPDHLQYAIYCYALYGPWFGNGNTIYVCDNCAACNSSYTRLYGYVNDTGLNDYTVFTGERYFTVKEIEVFTLTE